MGLIAKGQDLQPCSAVVSGLPARRRSGEQGQTMRGGKMEEIEGVSFEGLTDGEGPRDGRNRGR